MTSSCLNLWVQVLGATALLLLGHGSGCAGCGPLRGLLGRLGGAFCHALLLGVLRLDAADPVVAWQERSAVLKRVASQLTERRFDGVHFSGPGTELTVGLLRSSRWLAAEFTTVEGKVHYPNLPSEEIFTTPDPARAEGHVAATKPLEFYGSHIEGIRVRFEGGRAADGVVDKR